MLLGEGAILFAAAAAAGVVNSVAGGGTLLTFPALLAVGLPDKVANATSTVALWPGAIAATAGYRKDLAGARPFMVRMAVPSVLGGAAGAVLLLWTGKDLFARLVPWLVLFATALFAVSGPLGRRLADLGERSGERAGKRALLFQFAVAVYGGYFGAGIGILMLAALALLGLTDIHRMNGMKILLGALVNSTAVFIFAAAGIVAWPAALIMAVGAALGGFGGASAARHLKPTWVRTAVIAVGLVVAAARFRAVYGG